VTYSPRQFRPTDREQVEDVLTDLVKSVETNVRNILALRGHRSDEGWLVFREGSRNMNDVDIFGFPLGAQGAV
jgi:hypothetical protein